MIDPVLFQVSLTVIGFSIFSLVFAGIYYYSLTLALSMKTNDVLSLRKALAQSLRARPEAYRRRGDILWTIGFSLLVLEPSLILFTVGLPVVAVIFLALWIIYFTFAVYIFTSTES